LGGAWATGTSPYIWLRDLLPSAATHPEQIEERVLGRSLAAAFIATRQGIGLDYARKRHVHEPVGEFWLSVARMVIDQMAQQAAPPVGRGPGGIQ
jgi:hypothetical protein